MYIEKLKDLRDETELKQKNLANILGIERAVYGIYETEYRIFPIKHLVKICEIFDVSLDYILGFSDQRNYKNMNYEINVEKSGKRLRDFRKGFNLTLHNLGESLNCSYGTISQIECAKIVMSTSILYDLCRRYSLSADYMLGMSDNPRRIKPVSKNAINTKWKTEDNDIKIYSKRLKKLRNDENVKQEELAKILDIDSSLYSHYEREDFLMPIKHLNTLCKYFNVSIDYILGFTDLKNYKNNTNDINLALSGKRIKELRANLKLSQAGLADRLKCSATTITKYENGNNIISTPLLYDLCKKFNVSADYILGRTNSSEKIEFKSK